MSYQHITITMPVPEAEVACAMLQRVLGDPYVANGFSLTERAMGQRVINRLIAAVPS